MDRRRAAGALLALAACIACSTADHPEDEIPLLDDMTTTVRPTPGFLLTTTTLTPVTQVSQDCMHDDQIFADGALIKTEKACEHCYCMKGDIVCVVQECGTPMENEGKNCSSLPPRQGQCCPDTYICEGDELSTDQSPDVVTEAIIMSTNPPRKGVEGSGYRNEPDEPYTDMPIFDTTEVEGSGEDESTLAIDKVETLVPEKQTPDLEDEMFLTTAKVSEYKPSSTAEPGLDQTKVPKLESSADQSSSKYEYDITTESVKPGLSAEDESKVDAVNKDVDTTLDIGNIKLTPELSLTTIKNYEYDSPSTSESLTSREDQLIVTTESTYRKEDNVPTLTEITTKSSVNKATTGAVFNEATTGAVFNEATSGAVFNEATTRAVFNEATTGAVFNEATTGAVFNEATTGAVFNEATSGAVFNEATTGAIFNEATTGAIFNEATTGAIFNEPTTGAIFNEATTQSGQKVTDSVIYEHKVTAGEYMESTTLPQDVKITGTHTNIDDIKTITTEFSPVIDKNTSDQETSNELSSSSTFKPDLPEVTTLNSIENEIYEDLSLPDSSSRIPGEGDCLLNGITYKNYSTVPSTNKCHTQCKCVSSIVKCDPIICSPPPEYANMNNCQPIYDNSDSCCPTYICDHSKETVLPESHSQMSGTESSKPIHGSDCNGNECQIIEEIENKPEQPDCGVDGCTVDTGSTTAYTEDCLDGKCKTSPQKELPCNEKTGCQVPAVKPCEGEDCIVKLDLDAKEETINCENNNNCGNIQPSVTEKASCKDGICTSILPPQSQGDVEKDCDNDSCRRKETSKDEIIVPAKCIGQQCDNPPETDKILNELTTQAPTLSEETTKIIETDISTPISSLEYLPTKTDQKLSSTLAEETTTSSDTSSNKVDLGSEKYTTPNEEYHPVAVTVSSDSKSIELTTTKQPEDEKESNEISSEREPSIEMSTTIPDTNKEKEYFTTTSHNLLTEPALAEENTEPQDTEEKISGEKEFPTELPIPSTESDAITISEIHKITTPSSVAPKTSPHDHTLSDFEKDINMIKVNIENTTPVIDDENRLKETDITESSLNKDETNNDNEEKDLTTLSFISNENDHTTEAVISNTDELTPNILVEFTTKSQESHDVEENFTDGKIIDSMYTTQRNLQTTKEHEIISDISTTKKTIEDSKMPLIPTELTESMSTETSVDEGIKQTETSQISNDSNAEHRVTTVSTEIMPVDIDQYKTTDTLDASQKDFLGTKEPKYEESYTKMPLLEDEHVKKITVTTEQYQMESMNGRGTELPNYAGVEEELQTEVNHSYKPDTYTTISEDIETGFDKTQTELPVPVTESTSEKTKEENIVTKLPTEEENEMVKTDTDSAIITEPSKTEDLSTELNQVNIDTNDNVIITGTIEKLTTKLPPSPDHFTKDTFDEKVIEPQEITQKTEQSVQTESAGSLTITDEQTEAAIDHHKLSTADLHILEPHESLVTTPKPADKVPEDYEVEISTSKISSKFEDVAETFTESLVDITQQTDGLKVSEEGKPITSTEPYIDAFTTHRDALPIVGSTTLPETSENIIQTFTTIEDKDITPTVSSVKDDVSVEILPSEGSIIGSNEIGIATELDNSEETNTFKPELTTNIYEKSPTEDKKETTISTHITDESYPHDQISETNLVTEEEIMEKATTLSPEEESHKGYLDQKPNLVSQEPDIEDTRATTSRSIATDIQGEEKYTEKPVIVSTETQDSISEQDNWSTEFKDKSTEIPDLTIPTSQTEVSEVISDISETLKTTHAPHSDLTENLYPKKEEHTTSKTPEEKIYLEDSTIKIEEMAPTEEYLTASTESPERVTKIEDSQEKTTQQILTSEKITEGLEQTYNTEIKTESPAVTVKVTSDGITNNLDTLSVEIINETTTPEVPTESEKISTKPSYNDNELKITKPSEHNVEGEVTLEDKEIFTEIPMHVVTDMPITWSLETGTVKLPESLVVDDNEKTTIAQQAVSEDLLTASPEVVTEKMQENVNNDDETQKTLDIPKVTDAPYSKFTDNVEEVLKLDEKEKLDKTSANPIVDSTTEEKDHNEETNVASEMFVPVETTSQLPENGSVNKEAITITYETETEDFSDLPEISSDKPLETVDKSQITEHNEISSTLASIEVLSEDHLSKPTPSSMTVSTNKTSETSESLDSDKTISEVPVLSLTQPSESDLLKDFSPKPEQEGTTQTNLLSTIDANTKTEMTSEEGLSESNTVPMDEDKITSSDLGQQYTQGPEEIFTDLQKTTSESSEPITENEIFKTETSVPAIQKTDEEKLSTTSLDVDQQFTQRPDEALTDQQKSTSESSEPPTENEIFKTEIYVPTTQKTVEEKLTTTFLESFTTLKSDAESPIPVSLDTEIYPSVTDKVQVSDDQIIETKVPELDKYTTEIPTLITHETHKETTEKEIIPSEPPVTTKEHIEVTQKLYEETTSQPKQSDYVTTEQEELSTKLEEPVDITLEPNLVQTKPEDETSKLPQYTIPTSKPTDEYLESTPYFIELEEHTHKSIERVTPEEGISTVKLEAQHPEKEEYDVTTEKLIIDEQEIHTEDEPKETEVITEREKDIGTTLLTHYDLDTLHTTDLPLEKSTDQPTTPHVLYTESQSEVSKHSSTSYDKEISTSIPVDTTVTYEKQETPKPEVQATSGADTEKESAIVTEKPLESISHVHETTAPEDEFIPAITKGTSTKLAEDITTLPPIQFDKFTSAPEKPIGSSPSTSPEMQKPGFNEVLPTDDLHSTDDDSHFPPTGSSGYGQEPDYAEEDQAFGPGTCRYGGKVYVSAQQIPRDDPCDFCFCFRSDIICLQQSCPPPIHGCHEEPIQGFCCPRYECPVSMATTLNITTTTTTTTTTLPPHFLPHAYKGAAQRRGCQIKGHTYKVGEVVRASSGPCLHCTL
ncbi:unnamed protein product, partial [Iphiclides podalirius]